MFGGVSRAVCIASVKASEYGGKRQSEIFVLR